MTERQYVSSEANLTRFTEAPAPKNSVPSEAWLATKSVQQQGESINRRHPRARAAAPALLQQKAAQRRRAV